LDLQEIDSRLEDIEEDADYHRHSNPMDDLSESIYERIHKLREDINESE
jgi:hypothetical protein